MEYYALTGLVEIQLPAKTIRLCDGGVIRWGVTDFVSSDPDYGSIGAIESLEEGVGVQVPALSLTMLPPGPDAAALIAAPGNQASPARFWLADYNRATNRVVGTPQLLFNGMVDQLRFAVRRDGCEIGATIVSLLERFFELNIGNSLSSTFHKSIWPGETGMDQATGLSRPVAWGIEAPPGYNSGGSGGSYGGGGGSRGGFASDVFNLV